MSYDWNNFTEQDHQTWATLCQRQNEILKKHAAPEALDAMQKLKMEAQQIPKFADLNKILKEKTRFEIVPVEGLIPSLDFFEFLANRQFPSTYFIRKPEQLDYLEAPDIFHDVYGHVPLLVEPIFADFMEKLGHWGLAANQQGRLEEASRIYWYTVEFGLVKGNDGLKVYGAGLLSSIGETLYSVESPKPNRFKADLNQMKNMPFHTDSYQTNYFVIDSFESLFNIL